MESKSGSIRTRSRVGLRICSGQVLGQLAPAIVQDPLVSNGTGPSFSEKLSKIDLSGTSRRTPTWIGTRARRRGDMPGTLDTRVPRGLGHARPCTFSGPRHTRGPECIRVYPGKPDTPWPGIPRTPLYPGRMHLGPWYTRVLDARGPGILGTNIPGSLVYLGPGHRTSYHRTSACLTLG